MNLHDFLEAHQALNPEWLQQDDDYRELADHVIAQFNPPDSDAAEISILTDAVTRAAEFISAQPCTCPPAAKTNEVEPCNRCAALGRRCDEAVQR